MTERPISSLRVYVKGDEVSLLRVAQNWKPVDLVRQPMLTDLECDSLVALVAAIANDGLDTYGLSAKQEAAVRRALDKLARESASRP